MFNALFSKHLFKVVSFVYLFLNLMFAVIWG